MLGAGKVAKRVACGRPGHRSAGREPPAGCGDVRDDRALHPPGCSRGDDLGVDWPGDHVPQRRLRWPLALGLIATASRVGTAFYAFGLVLLPTLAFIGLVTYERVLQSGIEDRGYARRIALLRGYYFGEAPELIPYLLSVPEAGRLEAQGLWGGRRQRYRTVPGMVAVITAVLAGSAVGLLAAVVADHSLVAALGGVVVGGALLALMRSQGSAPPGLRGDDGARRRAQCAVIQPRLDTPTSAATRLPAATVEALTLATAPASGRYPRP